MTKIIFPTIINLIKPKAGAKQELLFDAPEVGLLNKSSFLAAALGVIIFITVISMNLVTLCCAA